MMSAWRKPFLVIGTGAVVAVLIAILTSGSSGYTVRAEFADLGGLKPDSSVKVAGIVAGTVQSVHVTKDDHAIAVLQLDADAAPIGQGASVEVRPTDLLGERYASVLPGDRTHPLPSGSLIPISRTSTPVELDDIINVLDPSTQTRLGFLINEIGVGLAGRGADLNQTLAEMPQTLGETRALVDQVASQNVALRDMITRGAGITRAINSRRQDLGTLLHEGQTALATLARNRSALGSTLQQAPGGLAELQSTLGTLSSASSSLRPAAVALHQAAQPLNAALLTLPAFSRAASPTLRIAADVAPALTRLGTQATPTIERLRPTAAQLTAVLRPAKPILDELKLRGMSDILYFINNMDLGLKARDSLGHLLGAYPLVSTQYLNAYIGGLQAAEKTTPARRPAVRKPATLPTPAAALPPLPTLPTVHLPALPKLGVGQLLGALGGALNGVKGTLAGVAGKVGGLAGGAQHQIGGLLQGLLGGAHHGGSGAPSQSPSAASTQRLLNFLLGR